MVYEIDVDRSADGTIIGIHYFDDSAVTLALLAPHSGNAASQADGGWSVQTKLAGFPAGTTRWQVLLAHAAGPNASAALRAANFK